MKNLCLGSVALIALAAAGPAIAADMPVKAARMQAVPAVPVYNWSGYYIGANAGYGWGDSSFNYTGENGAGQILVDPSGFFGIGGPARTIEASGFIGGANICGMGGWRRA